VSSSAASDGLSHDVTVLQLAALVACSQIWQQHCKQSCCSEWVICRAASDDELLHDVTVLQLLGGLQPVTATALHAELLYRLREL
jgi:hypothetical protein